MWYFIFSIITAFIIVIEKSNNDKNIYIFLSLFFPTIGYSLWRVCNNSELKNKYSPIKRICIWFSLMHTLLTIAWLVAEYTSKGVNSHEIGIILTLWAGAVSLSGIILKVYNIEKTISN